MNDLVWNFSCFFMRLWKLDCFAVDQTHDESIEVVLVVITICPIEKSRCDHSYLMLIVVGRKVRIGAWAFITPDQSSQADLINVVISDTSISVQIWQNIITVNYNRPKAIVSVWRIKVINSDISIGTASFVVPNLSYAQWFLENRMKNRAVFSFYQNSLVAWACVIIWLTTGNIA